ncbi:hypothetical protein EL18_00606 [Nitratireductor basaltis]|uniref:Uncharacterized protein n=1 Tax=Nitratireductor basaltis TaxID=472175 RepID=A0A084U9F4_9HYPH|nr:hypothetical protein EL18_00606 [Nitratireductor basaltis]
MLVEYRLAVPLWLEEPGVNHAIAKVADPENCNL